MQQIAACGPGSAAMHTVRLPSPRLALIPGKQQHMVPPNGNASQGIEQCPARVAAAPIMAHDNPAATGQAAGRRQDARRLDALVGHQP